MDLMDQRYVPEAAAPQYYLTSSAEQQQLQTAHVPGDMPSHDANPDGLSGAVAAAADSSTSAAGGEQQGGGPVPMSLGGTAETACAAAQVGTYHAEQSSRNATTAIT